MIRLDIAQLLLKHLPQERSAVARQRIKEMPGDISLVQADGAHGWRLFVVAGPAGNPHRMPMSDPTNVGFALPQIQ